MPQQTYFGVLSLPNGETRALYLLLTPSQAERTRATMEQETGARWIALDRSTTRKRDRRYPTVRGIPALA